MSTPKKARPLVPRVQVKVIERTMNLLPPGFRVAVTRSTINVPCCFVRIEKEKP